MPGQHRTMRAAVLPYIFTFQEGTSFRQKGSLSLGLSRTECGNFEKTGCVQFAADNTNS